MVLRRYFLWCAVLIGVTVISSAAIIFRTKIDAHPDEIYHLDAFCYFENHWWYPDIGAPGLRYGPFGDARAVNPEIVYGLFGRTGAVIKPFAILDCSNADQEPGQSDNNKRKIPDLSSCNQQRGLLPDNTMDLQVTEFGIAFFYSDHTILDWI